MRHRLLVWLVLTALLICPLTACSSRQTPSGQGILRMNIATEPPTLDPLEATDLTSITILMNVMRGLVQYGPNHSIVPAYAERWDISPDGSRYTFHLRKTGRWSDGKPLTAHDFVYAWRRVLTPENGSAYAFLLFDIHNARAFYEKRLTDPTQLGFKALDDTTLEVQLDRPVAFFLPIMAFSISLPVREDNVTRFGKSFTEAGHFLTSGPYVLEHWQHESLITLKPNPYYWQGVPKNQGVQLMMIPESNTSLIMYENNELDFVETTESLPVKEVRRVRNRPDFHQKTLYAISYFGFNTQKPPFNDVRVRRAFAHALDKTYYPKLFLSGEEPISSWIPPGLFAYTPHIGLAYDVAKARRELAQAGYPGGKGFPKVSLMYTNMAPENRQAAEIAQYQWKKNLGVDVELDDAEWKVFLKQLDTDPPQIYRLQWYADYPDPDTFMGMFVKDSGNNHTRWHSPLYDKRVAEAAIEQDPLRRQALYDAAQRQLLEENTAILPVYVVPKAYLVKPRVHGFILDELNIPRLEHVTLSP